MASTFNTYLAYVAEATAGTTPSGTPSTIFLPTTDPLAIVPEKGSFRSETKMKHRQAAAISVARDSVGGSIPIEFSYDAYDDFLEALLGGAWTSNVLKVGNAVKTFSVEQGFPDAGQYIVYKGVTPTAFNISANAEGIVTGSFDLVGMGYGKHTSSPLNASPTSKYKQPYDGLANAVIKEGGNTIGIVTSIDLSINANKTVGGFMGSKASSKPVNGLLEVTGTITLGFEDDTYFGKFADGTDTKLELTFKDPEDNDLYTKIEIPSLKYTGAPKSDSDIGVVMALPFTASYDETSVSSIVITRGVKG